MKQKDNTEMWTAMFTSSCLRQKKHWKWLEQLINATLREISAGVVNEVRRENWKLEEGVEMVKVNGWVETGHNREEMRWRPYSVFVHSVKFVSSSQTFFCDERNSREIWREVWQHSIILHNSMNECVVENAEILWQ